MLAPVALIQALAGRTAQRGLARDKESVADRPPEARQLDPLFLLPQRIQ